MQTKTSPPIGDSEVGNIFDRIFRPEQVVISYIEFHLVDLLYLPAQWKSHRPAKQVRNQPSRLAKCLLEYVEEARAAVFPVLGPMSSIENSKNRCHLHQCKTAVADIGLFDPWRIRAGKKRCAKVVKISLTPLKKLICKNQRVEYL